MTAETLLFSLLRPVLCDEEAGEDIKCAITAEMLPKLYSLSKAHDLAHLVGQALSDMGVLGSDEISEKFRQQAMQAVYRYAKQNYSFGCICQALEDAKIPFIPLKGSVIRAYYPQEWMRTSCDVDILVKEADLPAALQTLRQMGGQHEKRGTHDVAMRMPGGVYVELHFDTIEENRAVHCREVLSEIWEYTSPGTDRKYHCVMADEMFYFYHIAHMAKHLEIGGCGVRPFLDLWILEHKVAYDPQKRNALLRRGGLLRFAEAARKLSEVWLSGAEPDALSRQLEAFILKGGSFGTAETAVAVKRAGGKGKTEYILSRLFLPYKVIKAQNPILETHKWLVPVYQVKRWVKMVQNGKLGVASQELRQNNTASQRVLDDTAALLEQLGLK